MDREYYMIFNIEENTKSPIVCDGYQIHDGGWVEFYEGNMDFVTMAIPGRGFWYSQITKEVYDAAEAEAAESGVDFLDDQE